MKATLLLLVAIATTGIQGITLVQYGDNLCLKEAKRYENFQPGYCVQLEGTTGVHSVKYVQSYQQPPFTFYDIGGYHDTDCDSQVYRASNLITPWTCQPIKDMAWRANASFMIIDGSPQPQPAPAILHQFGHSGQCLIANRSWYLKPGTCTNINTASYQSLWFYGCMKQPPYNCSQALFSLHGYGYCADIVMPNWFENGTCRQFNIDYPTDDYYTFHCEC